MQLIHLILHLRTYQYVSLTYAETEGFKCMSKLYMSPITVPSSNFFPSFFNHIALQIGNGKSD